MSKADSPEARPVGISDRKRLLFLCAGNSCRSQMAEGLARAMLGSRLDVCSAGLERHGLNPMAVEVMQEVGVDISGYRSKTLDDLAGPAFDYVVTVCGHADETCPVFPQATTKLHRGFDDPPKLAASAETRDEALAHYRRVRDEIREFILTLPQILLE